MRLIPEARVPGVGSSVRHFFKKHNKNHKAIQFEDISRMLDLVESVPGITDDPSIVTNINETRCKVAFVLENIPDYKQLTRDITRAREKAREGVLDAVEGYKRGWFHRWKRSYYDYSKFYEIFGMLDSANPHLFINLFLTGINGVLANHLSQIQEKKGEKDNENSQILPNFTIFEVFDNFRSGSISFDQAYNQVQHGNTTSKKRKEDVGYGNTGLFLLFQLCIREQVGLDDLIKKLEEKVSNLRRKKDSSITKLVDQWKHSEHHFMFWNYRNLLRYAQTKKRVSLIEAKLEAEKKEGVVVALSGGIGNGIIQIGVVKKLIEQGKPIKMITGYSIGAIVGTLLAFALNGDKKHNLKILEDITQDMISGFTLKGRTYKLAGSLKHADDREQIKQFFLHIGEKYGVKPGVPLGSSNIPILVGAVREYGHGVLWETGDQEMVLGEDDEAINAAMASSNLGGLFGRFEVEKYEARDYGENERGSMTEPLKILGIKGHEIHNIIIGYLGLETPTTYFGRSYWPESLMRDLIEHWILKQKGGKSVRINSANINKSGEAKRKKRTTKKIWEIHKKSGELIQDEFGNQEYETLIGHDEGWEFDEDGIVASELIKLGYEKGLEGDQDRKKHMFELIQGGVTDEIDKALGKRKK